MKQDISLARGRTYVFELAVNDADGEPYILQDGETLIFGIKRLYSDPIYRVKKIITPEMMFEDGLYELELEPKDTLRLPIGDYCYDVGLQSGKDFFEVIEYSKFSLTKNVTKAEVKRG